MSGIFQRFFSLHGKAALITGASGGIGSTLAAALAEAGAAVALNGLTAGKLEAAKHRIDAVGGSAVILRQDIQTVENCRELIATAQAKLGRLDILVNCAGVNRRKPGP